jgi:hypothetical protein
MLMKNSALRLYRLPRESQLLQRLGGTWRAPRGRPTHPLHPGTQPTSPNKTHSPRLNCPRKRPPPSSARSPTLAPPGLGARLSQDLRICQKEDDLAWVAQVKTDMSSDTILPSFAAAPFPTTTERTDWGCLRCRLLGGARATSHGATARRDCDRVRRRSGSPRIGGARPPY